MPKVSCPYEQNIFQIFLSEDELDNLAEIAVIKKASINEIIEACFVIGSMKMTESLKRPAYPT